MIVCFLHASYWDETGACALDQNSIREPLLAKALSTEPTQLGISLIPLFLSQLHHISLPGPIYLFYLSSIYSSTIHCIPISKHMEHAKILGSDL